MTTNKDFSFFLTDEEGRSFAEDATGSVTANSTPTPMPDADGWLEMGLGWDRNMDEVGMVRNFSTPITFVGKARRILLDLYLRSNYEKKLFLLIKRKVLDITLTTFLFVLRHFYKGALDLTTIKDDPDTGKTTVNILEGGIIQAYKANRATDYEIDFSESEIVELDGIILTSSMNFLVPKSSKLIGTDSAPIVYIDREGNAPYIEGVSQDFSPGTDFFLVNNGTTPQTVHPKGSLVFTPSPGAQQVIVRLYRIPVSGGWIIEQENIFNPATTTLTTVTIDRDVTLLAGEKLFLFVRSVKRNISVDAYVDYEETRFTVTFASRYRSTRIRCIRPSVLFEKLVEKATGIRGAADSSFLKAHDNLMLTCGDRIRGLEEINGAPVVLKTSLDKFRQFCKGVMAAGIGVSTSKIIIQSYDWFFDNTQPPVELGEVTKFTWEPAADLLANQAIVGYPNQNIDEFNGKFEFNNTHKYNLPVTRAIRDFSVVCPYLSQPYLIEQRRANLDGKTTTDNQQDNDVFILNVDLNQRVTETLVAENNSGPKAYEQASDLMFDSVSGSALISTTDSVHFKMEKSGHVDLKGEVYFTALDPTGYITLRVNGQDRLTFQVGSARFSTFAYSSFLNAGDTFEFWMEAPGGDFVIQSLKVTATLTDLAAYPLKREAYDVLQGVPDATVFNIEELTPHRLLLKQMRWLNSLLYNINGEITFGTTEKNAELYTQKGTVAIRERSNEIIGTDRLFIPIYFNCEANVPVNLAEVLDDNPRRPFRFTVEGETFKGFLIKGGLAVASREQQQFKLLCCPDVDITKLK